MSFVPRSKRGVPAARNALLPWLAAPLACLAACANLGVDDARDVHVESEALEVGPATTFLIDNGNSFGGSYAGDISPEGQWLAYTAPTVSGLGSGYQLHVRDIVHQVIDPSTNKLMRGTDQPVVQFQPGQYADNEVREPKISSGGRYVAFWTLADNIIPGDTNNNSDVFLYDRTTKQTVLASRNTKGAPGNNASSSPQMSIDGTRIAFWSTSSDLVAGDTNKDDDVFVFDLPTGSVRRVSLTSTGAELAQYHVSPPDISPDGRYITYLRQPVGSTATDIVQYDYTNKTSKVLLSSSSTWSGTGIAMNALTGGTFRNGVLFFSAFVPQSIMANCSAKLTGSCIAIQTSQQCVALTLATGAYEVVSAPHPSTAATSFSQLLPSGACDTIDDVSSDGRYVIYESYADNLIPSDTNGVRDLFRYDRTAKHIERINETSGGLEVAGATFTGAVSDDGRFVSYQSIAPNLTTYDPNGGSVSGFLYDRGAYAGDLWTSNYGTASTPAFVSTGEPVMLADVNGDKLDDVVGFSDSGFWVSLNDPQQPSLSSRFFGPYQLSDFGTNQGYTVANNPRMMADVNGDGRADIVGFKADGVYVALSQGGASFSTASRWIAGFGTTNGWTVANNPRFMADVNGDGKADVVGFANAGTYVALSTGTGFAPMTQWIAQYGYNEGWRVATHPRIVQDVNHDGRADVVGFFDDGVHFSLSTGTGFTTDVVPFSGFGVSSGWAGPDDPRELADVDGDGNLDIVGFGGSNVYVSKWNASKSTFDAPLSWYTASFTYAHSWRATHARLLGDINGDGKADIVGCGANHCGVAVSNGSAFVSQETPATFRTIDFTGYTTIAGWASANNLRVLADVTGDGTADLVGFGSGGVYVQDFD